ncbi:helix-turn-helix domain-containing protein [Fluviibacterium sp. DFM31]|uniref:Helix-turn-helix domain-containing protein n=2 Tax=Meridianimarinicoccus marinus TaxID=3231483 RepID=A0ABV3LBW6_9RHOB
MPQNLPLVKLSLLRPYVAELRKRGVDPELVFESVGLSEDLTFDPDLSVHVMVATQFVENAAEATKDRFLAARVAANLNLDGWPVLADAEARAATVGDYLSIFVSTANEIASSAEEYLHLNGATAILGERRNFDPAILPAQNDAFMAALGWAILRRALHDHFDPAKVTVVVSEPKVLPPEFDLLHPIKGDRMGFNLSFPSSWLAMPFEQQTLANAPKAVIDDGTPEFVRSFRQMLRAHIGKVGLTAVQCADLASMSQQKLKRRLATFGTDISREVDFVRQEYAREALKTTDRSIADIAASLGFADAANFTRAFRRANRMSPTGFRKSSREQTDLKTQ